MKIFQKFQILFLSVALLLQTVGFYSVPSRAATVKAVTPAVSIGSNFMVALSTQGVIYAWGDNAYGTLGDGTTASRSYAAAVTMPEGVTFTQVSAGTNHVVALTADGHVYTWGANVNGQLGYEGGTQKTPNRVAALDAFEGTVYAVAAGNSYTMALMSNGRILMWGYNSKLPLEDTSTKHVPKAISISGEGNSAVFFTSIFAGSSSAAAISASGTVYFCGDNQDSKLGILGSNLLSWTAHATLTCDKLAFGNTHTTALTSDGSLKHAGKNDKNQLGKAADDTSYTTFVKTFDRLFVDIAAGTNYSVGVTEAGQVYTWGQDTNGALGSSTSTNATKHTTPEQVVLTDITAISVAAKNSNVAIVTDDGRIYTWGSSVNNSSTPVAVRIGEAEDALLELGQGPAVITQTAHISLQANIPAPTYTVTIPSTIAVGELEQTIVKNDKSHLSNSEFTVKISDVNHLFGEKKIVVTVSSDDSLNRFVLKDTSDTTHILPYSVLVGEQSVEPNGILANFTEDGEVVGIIQIDRSKIARDGSYQGTMIFTVSVESLPAVSN